MDGVAFVTAIRGWSLSARILAVGLVLEGAAQALSYTVLSGGMMTAWRTRTLGLFFHPWNLLHAAPSVARAC